MNRKSLISFKIVLVFLCLIYACGCLAEDKRMPVFAGRFYPADKAELVKLIDGYTTQAARAMPDLADGRPLKALILPHAGYIYSGPTAAYASLVLDKGLFKKVVVMGPDHRVGFSDACISDADAYSTPLGDIPCHPDAKVLRDKYDFFSANELSDNAEHSIEVVLPFFQRYIGKFELIPIVMGPGDIHGYTRAVDSVLDERTLIVASSDLSHFLTYEQAVALDRSTIELILKLKTDELHKKTNRACGMIPIRIICALAREKGWEARLLHYSNSGDTSGPKDSVVGYAAIAFYGGQRMKNGFTDEQGNALLRLARNTIEEYLGVGGGMSEQLKQVLVDDALKEKKGAFVTINIHDNLRGCIGYLEGREPLVDAVKHNAINAAFHDPRFSPLRKAELDKITIEVSILSDPARLSYADSSDLLNKLRPGMDGVIIQLGHAKATFLPQVWDQLPDKEEFLSHLCRKAGLNPFVWKDKNLEVYTYQVQYFEEEGQ